MAIVPEVTGPKGVNEGAGGRQRLAAGRPGRDRIDEACDRHSAAAGLEKQRLSRLCGGGDDGGGDVS